MLVVLDQPLLPAAGLRPVGEGPRPDLAVLGFAGDLKARIAALGPHVAVDAEDVLAARQLLWIGLSLTTFLHISLALSCRLRAVECRCPSCPNFLLLPDTAISSGFYCMITYPRRPGIGPDKGQKTMAKPRVSPIATDKRSAPSSSATGALCHSMRCAHGSWATSRRRGWEYRRSRWSRTCGVASCRVRDHRRGTN